MINLKSKYYFSCKVFDSGKEALKDIKDGSTVLFGGFGICGIPENSIRALLNLGTKDLTCITNDCGTEDWGMGLLLREGRMKKIVGSYIGDNKEVEKQYLSGNLEIELVPLGSFAEKLRSGTAGIPAFYTATGVGTLMETGGFPMKYDPSGKTPVIISQPKKKEIFNGKSYLLEESIRGDYAIIKAQKADKYGNLVCKKAARNFNADMAGAAKITIAEVEEIVEPGEIKPDEIHIPGVYIQRVFKGEYFEKKIKRVVYESDSMEDQEHVNPRRIRIAQRAVKELKEGMVVNLGLGIPTLVAQYAHSNLGVIFQSENGILGVGKYPKKGQEDPDLVNARKETITTIPGASFFSASESFSMIRGNHLDLTMMGAMQVSCNGDLANWVCPGKIFKGVGGAMDLAASGMRVVILMHQLDKDNEPKLTPQISIPVTGKQVVDTLITDMAVFKWKNGEMTLHEIAKEYSLEDLRKATTCYFHVENNLQTF